MAELIHDIIASEPWYNEETCSLSVILSCVGRLYNNRFAISNYDNTELAIGLYPLAYLINHRCTPNATFVFDGTRMYLRSITAIHKNEEITVQLYSNCSCRSAMSTLPSRAMFATSAVLAMVLFIEFFAMDIVSDVHVLYARTWSATSVC